MESDLLRIATHRNNSTVRFDLIGELDLSSAPDLTEAFAGAAGSCTTRIEVDLSQLVYTDSIGLSLFVTAHYQCLDAGITLSFFNPNLFIARLLECSGLNQILSVCDVGAVVAEFS